jgi:mannitol-1-/sugar-/sorbitol-6-phosphatase
VQSTSSLVQVQTTALLFDMDGVLIDSIAAVERCWRQWALMYGIPDADKFHVPHGVRAGDIVRMLKPEFSEAQVAEGLRTIEDLEVADTDDTVALSGAKDLLSLLPPDRWAIVTSATRRLADARLAAAGLPVPERMITGDMVARGKPDPEPYRRGAELLGFMPSDCIVVEDAPSGVNAGLAAGARVIGVLGTHNASQLIGASWVAASLKEIDVRVLADHIDLRFSPVATLY